MPWVADFSGARPDPAALVASGCVGVMRYLGDGALAHRYNITKPEMDAYHRAGLKVGLVWEREADRMRYGALAGGRDAQVADAQADALGFPRDRPIFYANDVRDGFLPEAVAYMQGVLRVTKRPVGAYGSGKFCAVSGAQYRWRVATWPGFNITTHLIQEPNIASPIPGTDYNSIHADDWGGYLPNLEQQAPLSQVIYPAVPISNEPAVNGNGPTGQSLLDAAYRFRGEPYSTNMGRTSQISGYKDCSGLIVAAFSVLGIQVGGTVSTSLERWAIASGGRYLSREEALVTPGAGLTIGGRADDWNGLGPRGHVGLSVGDGQRAFETPSSEGRRAGFSPFSRNRWTGYFTWGALDTRQLSTQGDDDLLIVNTETSKGQPMSLLVGVPEAKQPLPFATLQDAMVFAGQANTVKPHNVYVPRAQALDWLGGFRDP